MQVLQELVQDHCLGLLGGVQIRWRFLVAFVLLQVVLQVRGPVGVAGLVGSLVKELERAGAFQAHSG